MPFISKISVSYNPSYIRRYRTITDSTQYPSYRWLVLIAAAVSCINVQITNLSITPILPHIAQTLDIDLGVATYFMSAFTLSGSVVLLLIGGVVCDRFGIFTAIIISLLCAALPSALMPFIGNSYTGVFYARLVQGLAPGFIFPAMGAMIAIWFPLKEKGLATGLMSAAVAIGSCAGTMGGPIVFKMVDTWQQMSAWLSIVGWIDLAFIFLLLLLPRPQPPSQQAKAPDEADGNILKLALFAPLTVLGVLVTFMAAWDFQCLYGLTPTFLSADIPTGAGYGPLVSGYLMISVTVVSGILGPMVCGVLVDKVFKGDTKQVITMGFVLLCVFIYLMRFPFIHGSVPLISICLLLAGFGIQFVMPAIYIFIAKSYKHQIVGKMTGLWQGIGSFGGSLGLYLGGLSLRITGNYMVAFTMISLVALVGLVLSILMSKQKTLVEGR